MKVEVAVLVSPSLIVSMDVSGHHSPSEGSIILMPRSVTVSEAPSLPRLPERIFTCAHPTRTLASAKRAFYTSQILRLQKSTKTFQTCSLCLNGRRERGRDRQTDKNRDRDRQTDKNRDRDRQTDRQKQR